MFFAPIFLCGIFKLVSGFGFHPFGDLPFNNSITVAISERIPFAGLDDNGIPSGFDVSIIENFAKNYNLMINFTLLTVSLNNVFVNQKYFDAFFAQANLRYPSS